MSSMQSQKFSFVIGLSVIILAPPLNDYPRYIHYNQKKEYLYGIAKLVIKFEVLTQSAMNFIKKIMYLKRT